jgi:hypothetical protein
MTPWQTDGSVLALALLHDMLLRAATHRSTLAEVLNAGLSQPVLQHSAAPSLMHRPFVLDMATPQSSIARVQ